MRPPLVQLSAEETVVADDFKISIGKVFQPIYGDHWDEALWRRSVDEFEQRHSQPLIQICLKKLAGWESWDACRAHFKKGPPAFIRDDWVSPLLGRQVDLDIFTGTSLQWIKGGFAGSREADVLVVEIWATWCQPCVKVFPYLSSVAKKYGNRVKIIGVNEENIFMAAPIVDIPAFVAAQHSMEYSVALDSGGRVMDEIITPSGRIAIPTAIAITTNDGVVHFVGNPSKLDDILPRLFA